MVLHGVEVKCLMFGRVNLQEQLQNKFVEPMPRIYIPRPSLALSTEKAFSVRLTFLTFHAGRPIKNELDDLAANVVAPFIFTSCHTLLWSRSIVMQCTRHDAIHRSTIDGYGVKVLRVVITRLF